MITTTKKQERYFKGVWIPKEVYLKKDLSWTQKILLIEIDSLDGDNHCFASNAYFADFLNIDTMYVSQCISKLTAMGLITAEQRDGRRVLISNIRNLKEEEQQQQKKEIEKKNKFEPPTLLQVMTYFKEHGYSEEAGRRAYIYYSEGSPPWTDGRGNKVRSWKQKMQSVWFKPENKIKTTDNRLNFKIY